MPYSTTAVSTTVHNMERLINRISELLKTQSRVVIAIDGQAASGKTTLAEELSRRFGGCVIHTDDFFLPAELRTPERLAVPGGNIHYERFCDEVICGIMSGKPFEYSVFDCGSMSISGKKTAVPEGAVIIEGAYSLHPKIPDIYDIKVFLSAPLEIRLERILKRNGEKKLKMFTEKWIPLEEAYFAACGTKEKCDFAMQKAALH